VSIRSRSAAALFATAGVVWLLDRASKAWVEATLAGRPPLTVIPGVLDLRFTTNSGGAFSLGRSTPWLFVGGTVLVAGAIVFTAFRHEHLLTAVALGLVLGGALGNLTDRALRGPRLTGHVIDFVDLHIWPIFNIADSAVVIGAILLAISSLTAERREAAAPDAG
jgi:signal peptidase II